MYRKIIIKCINQAESIYDLQSFEDDVLVNQEFIKGTMKFSKKLLEYMLAGFTAKHEKGKVALIKND